MGHIRYTKTSLFGVFNHNRFVRLYS